jgi:hypothetical protein
LNLSIDNEIQNEEKYFNDYKDVNLIKKNFTNKKLLKFKKRINIYQ